jgi:hypothetical protein
MCSVNPASYLNIIGKEDFYFRLSVLHVYHTKSTATLTVRADAPYAELKQEVLERTKSHTFLD